VAGLADLGTVMTGHAHSRPACYKTLAILAAEGALLYDFEWHKRFGDSTATSAVAAITLLREFLTFDSVLDIGCGDGRWLAECLTQGATQITGVDGAWTDLGRLEIPADRMVIHDLATRLDLGRRYDLALSLEVAEHVAEHAAETFVGNLARHSDVVFFGAAIPHQGGFLHVNEQWQSYWRDLFAKSGFVAYDPIRGQIWDDERVCYWYSQNALLYVSKDRPDLQRATVEYILRKKVAQLPMDVVHPALYLTHATYEHISFGPMLKSVPRNISAKLRGRLRKLTSRPQ
jgi:SAM-dependent methyltransferase